VSFENAMEATTASVHITSNNLEDIINGSPNVLLIEINELESPTDERMQNDIYYITVVEVLKGDLQVGDLLRIIFFADTVRPGETHIVSVAPVSPYPYFQVFTSRYSLHSMAQRDEIVTIITGMPPPPTGLSPGIMNREVRVGGRIELQVGILPGISPFNLPEGWSIRWWSNSANATVETSHFFDAASVVTGVALGSATISAQLHNGTALYGNVVTFNVEVTQIPTFTRDWEVLVVFDGTSGVSINASVSGTLLISCSSIYLRTRLGTFSRMGDIVSDNFQRMYFALEGWRDWTFTNMGPVSGRPIDITVMFPCWETAVCEDGNEIPIWVEYHSFQVDIDCASESPWLVVGCCCMPFAYLNDGESPFGRSSGLYGNIQSFDDNLNRRHIYTDVICCDDCGMPLIIYVDEIEEIEIADILETLDSTWDVLQSQYSS